MQIIIDENLLRTKCEPVKNASEGFIVAKKLRWALDSVNKKHLNKYRKSFGKEQPLTKGLGLSAPQIGIYKQVCIISVGGVPIVLINPKIVECSEGMFTFEEGCLSMPETKVQTMRHDWIKVQALNHTTIQTYGNVSNDWSQHKLLQTVVAQHEIAHLYGLLMIDFVNKGPKATEWK